MTDEIARKKRMTKILKEKVQDEMIKIYEKKKKWEGW